MSVGTNFRHDEPVQLYASSNGDQNKINYPVPAGKVFFVEMFHVGYSEGDKYIVELQAGGAGKACVGGGEGKEGGEPVNFPRHNPLGPFAAGVIVRLRRVEGTSGKDWAGGIVGYLEDE